ncbi:MAG: GH39 family glycosyl hydrolase [Planctomycetaceae bacterium]
MTFPMARVCLRIVIGLLGVAWAGVRAAAPVERIAVDCGRETGRIRAIHGVNGGPVSNGENPDLRGWFQEAGFATARLHDCHWPCPDAVDIHTVFPLAHLDPDDPANYTFAKTDAYLRGIVDSGVGIVYRLGESIETKGTRYHITPPRDLDAFARVCVNIVRHCNEGWADGHRFGIRYWEIWNEPDVDLMWTGTKEEFLALYETVARAVEAHDPALKVGGPGFSDVNDKPEGWARVFLARCRDRKLPLDFFTFHRYGNDVAGIVEKVRLVRRLLDEYGFEKTEIHLNEFRYMPAGSWQGIRPRDPEKYVGVPAVFEQSTGAAGAAHAVSTLAALQDEPVAMTNYYSGDTSPWSMFGQFGIRRPVYHAYRAFNEVAKRPRRAAVAVEAAAPVDAVVAGQGTTSLRSAALAGVADDGRSVAVVVSTFGCGAGAREVTIGGLPWAGASRVETLLVDDTHPLTETPATVEQAAGRVTVAVDLPADRVCLVRVTPAAM